MFFRKRKQEKNESAADGLTPERLEALATDFEGMPKVEAETHQQLREALDLQDKALALGDVDLLRSAVRLEKKILEEVDDVERIRQLASQL